ncbi:MAG: PEGA domain-containing protein, partial [Candidatus Marinimicrobia bacterium]|nr:PEGA domain-containing protein [Candidatus Neomarinimicrobiota bacterium]
MHPLKAEGLNNRFMTDISNKIQITLKKNGNYFVLSNDQTREILQSQNIRFDTQCMDVNCLAAFGENTGVDFVIGGEVKLVPGGYHVKFILVGTLRNRSINSISKKLTDNIYKIIQNDIPSIINDLLDSPKFDVPRSLTVKSDVDSANVYMDGIFVGKTPFTTSEIGFGEHTV